jgi:hypothetical protein
MSAKDKLIRRPQAVTLFRDKPSGAATTVALAHVAGDTAIVVASATGISAGKSLRYGSGEAIERVEVASVASTTVTLVKPLVLAHAAGDAVVEQTGYDLGDVKGAVTITQATQSEDVQSAMRRLVFQKLQGFQNFDVSLSIYGVTLENMVAVLGIPLTNISGTGADADHPHVIATDFTDVDTEQNQCLVVTAVLQDGTVKTWEFWGLYVDYTGFSTSLVLGQDGAFPGKFCVIGAGIEQEGAPTFTPDLTTIRASKGKIFGELTSVGLWVAAGGNTTVGTAANAGATTLIVADASGLAAESWIGVGSQDTFETHWVESISTNTLTLKTPLLRAQAIGIVVQKITQQTFAAIDKNGAKLSIGGQTTPIQSGLRRLPLGAQAGFVDVALELGLLQLTRANRAYALGIPQADLDDTHSRLLISQDIGKDAQLAAFVAGVLKDGSICLINLWGPVVDVTSVATALDNSAGSVVPFKTKPTSGLQFLEYSA